MSEKDREPALPTGREVTDAELAVLKMLWESDEATIRELTDALYPDGSASEYATVQKLLERLEGKGHVCHRARGRVNVYCARVDRDTLIGRQLRRTAERLCDGSLAPLLSHLVRDASFDETELRELRELVGRLERSGLAKERR